MVSAQAGRSEEGVPKRVGNGLIPGGEELTYGSGERGSLIARRQNGDTRGARADRVLPLLLVPVEVIAARFGLTRARGGHRHSDRGGHTLNRRRPHIVAHAGEVLRSRERLERPREEEHQSSQQSTRV